LSVGSIGKGLAGIVASIGGPEIASQILGIGDNSQRVLTPDSKPWRDTWTHTGVLALSEAIVRMLRGSCPRRRNAHFGAYGYPQVTPQPRNNRKTARSCKMHNTTSTSLVSEGVSTAGETLAPAAP